MAFYRDVLGHQLIWRNEATGQAGLQMPESDTEIVLTTRQDYEPDWKVASADSAAEVFAANGGKVLVGPVDIPIGRLAVVEDPWRKVAITLSATPRGRGGPPAPATMTEIRLSPAAVLAYEGLEKSRCPGVEDYGQLFKLPCR